MRLKCPNWLSLLPVLLGIKTLREKPTLHVLTVIIMKSYFLKLRPLLFLLLRWDLPAYVLPLWDKTREWPKEI